MKSPLRLFAFFSLLLAFGTTLHAAERPNIMVFLIDDMGVMDTSVPFLTDEAGEPKRYPLNDYYRTPGMERLAERGVRFNQFYAMSVCSPTRISIMTGQNAARHRATNWINPRENNAGPQGPPEWNWKGLESGDVTLPGVLRKAGYKTIHVGKGHFGPNETEGENPANLGFDVNIGGSSFGAPGSYYGEEGYGAKRGRHAVPHLDHYHGTDTFLSEALTMETRKEIAKTVKEGKQPFYLYFSHYAVHAPFHSDPRFAAHYADSGKPEKANAFATLIEGMDKSLDDMLDQFEELGIAENTVVFFLGDNGSDAPLGHQHEVACSAPLRGKKGAHYEGGMRIPFIAAWVKPDPDNPHQKQLPIATGTIQGQVANVTDLYPTLLAIAGAEDHSPGEHEVDGHRLDKLLTGQRDNSRPEQFLMHYPHSPHRSVYYTVWRDGDWKVVYHALPQVKAKENRSQSDGSHYQLFNLKDDPFEQNDLAKSKPDKLKKMMAGLIENLEAHNPLYPVRDDGNPLKPTAPR
ncbi:MAG: sulfatase-like hydrolase/transferase [Verrucomicrobiota bacterium]